MDTLVKVEKQRVESWAKPKDSWGLTGKGIEPQRLEVSITAPTSH